MRQAGRSELEAGPGTLYELLGAQPDFDETALKAAYLRKMKLYHPDVTGENGTELTALLNDAYRVLSDPVKRAAYNGSLAAPVVREDTRYRGWDDLSPTWQRSRNAVSRMTEPVFDGTPRSRSLHDRLAEEDRGPKWKAKQFVFVNEYQCIQCWNCAGTAPNTFCMDSVQGKARVFAQYGDSEEDIDWAVASCPVDCISWHDRTELQALEYVNARAMWRIGGRMPFLPRVSIFQEAETFIGNFSRRKPPKPGSYVNGKKLDPEVASLQTRMRSVFRDLSGKVKGLNGRGGTWRWKSAGQADGDDL